MKEKIKKKLKSQKGFTMQDLIIACLILTLFVGLIGTLMYNSYYNNLRAELSANMTIYAVKILEDIDKISYEDVQTKTGSDYEEQFNIPAGYIVELNISNYGEAVGNVEDVIKIIKLKISYTFQGKTEDFVVQKLKIKEV